MYNRLVQRTGYSMAPMAPLTLNGVRATRTYQKSLDTIAKRDHIRLLEPARFRRLARRCI